MTTGERFVGRIHFEQSSPNGSVFKGEFQMLATGWVSFVNDDGILIFVPPHAIYQIEVPPVERTPS